jgi:acetyl esterase/lipase
VFLSGGLEQKLHINCWQDIELFKRKREHWTLSEQIHREKDSITMKDGKILQGYVYSSDITPTKGQSILFLHGLGGFAQDFSFEQMLSAMCLAGIRVFAYDYRFAGNSRQPNEKTLIQNFSPDILKTLIDDSKSAFEWVKNHEEVDPENISIMGASLGGHLALTAFVNSVEVKKVIALCASYDLSEVIKKNLMEGPFVHRLAFKFLKRQMKITNDNISTILNDFQVLSPLNQYQKDKDYSKKVYLAHCEGDSIIPYSYNFLKNQQELRLPAKNVLLFQKGSHEFQGYEAALMSRIVYWLTKT